MPPGPDDPTLDEQSACAAIESACPDLRPATVKPLGRGWDHDVHLANGEWVFRFPRNEIAARVLPTEERLLPWLASRLPLPVAQPSCVGILAQTGWPFARHRLLPGTTVCDAELDAKARACLAQPLAEFLRALHSIPVAESPAQLGPEPFGRFDTARRIPRALERLAVWKSEGLFSPAVVDQLSRAVEAPPFRLPSEKEVIVHSDIHTRNLLVDSSDALSGVIDWVDVHLGQRVLDIGGAFEVLPARARETFCGALGGVDDETFRWARWRGIEQATWAYAGAVERRDERFARACRIALTELAEV